MTVTSSNPAAPATSTTAHAPITQKSLGQDDFLKLLATQLAAQDPMQPMDDTQFISQMANFSSLQQMQALNQKFDGYTNAQMAASAPQYLGKQVTVLDPVTGHSISGVPSAVNTFEGTTTLTIDGADYPLSAITSVSTPTAPATTPTTTPTAS